MSRSRWSTSTRLSRREFGALTVSAVAAPLALTHRAPLAPLSAADVIDRIKKKIGVDRKLDTVDTIKAGDPATVVKAGNRSGPRNRSIRRTA